VARLVHIFFHASTLCTPTQLIPSDPPQHVPCLLLPMSLASRDGTALYSTNLQVEMGQHCIVLTPTL
jgi:hypothetical protein